MKVLLLLLLAGLCSGIQFPLQYVYHYRAKVSSGIPDINKRHWASSELKANLSVFVTSTTRVVFKLSDVSFSDYNGVKDCEHGQDQSAATPQLASQLGQFPFAVENGLLTFNSQEELWAINFYKSIVSLFSIAPLKEAFYKTSHNHSHSAAYDETEDTVMGKCRTTYTQHKLTGVAAAQREQLTHHYVTQDVQKASLGEYANIGTSKTTKTTGAGGRRRRQASKRPPSKTSKTSPRLQQAPAISNTQWEVVRSVNLDDCQDRVEHQHSLGGLYCLLSKDQCQNLFSRSSHGAYYLRGDENGMRLEKAKIRGAIVISPFGYETEHIETITKQILGLVSVNHLDIDAPNLTGDSTVTTDKLVYELTLPYVGNESPNYRWAKKGTMKQTIAALTGVHITEDIQRKNEARVVKMLQVAAELAASGSSEATQPAPVVLNYASILMYDFTKEEITRVATGLQQASLELFIGVLAEVGSAPAVEVMLELIKNGKVSPLRQVFFFASLNSNMKSATALRPLLNFLKSQDLDAAPFKTSQSLINFASVVNKLCLGRRDPANSFKEFAYQKCAQDGIVADLKGYLASQLQGADKFWKQMVLVQALVNLKSVEATNALLPYVLGARECDTMVRAVAMDSLAKWNAASALYKSQIVLILLDIFENPAESRLLRARALGYLASWELSSTEWTRLAFTTKRHGLKDLSAMTYSLIKATAEFEHPEMIQQRQYASHALSLAKPSSAAERYSSIKAWLSYAFGSQVGQVNHFSEVIDPMSPLPAELSLYIERSLGGAIFFRKMDFMIANDNGDLEDIATELFLGITLPNRDDSSKGRWTNFLSMIKTDLNIEAKLKTAIQGMANFLTTSEARLFVPFERVMLVDAMKSISGDRAPYLHLTGPSSLYMNSIDNTFTTVNDLGLPVITNVARPAVLSFKGSANFQNTGLKKFALGSESFGLKVSSSFRVNIETMIPWSHSKVAAGVSTTDTVNLPFSPTVEVSCNDDKRKPSFLIVNVAPSVFAKTALMTKVNMPYTLIRDAAPADLDEVARALKIIYVNGEKGPKYQKSRAIPFTTFEETYATDFTISFSSEDYIFKSSSGSEITLEKLILFPNLMFYSGSISVDFTGLQTSSLRLNFTSVTADRLSNAGKLVSKYGQDRFQDHELCGHEGSGDYLTQQTGQNAIEDYDEQDSQSSQNPEQEFENFGSGQQLSQKPAKLTDTTEAETARPSQGIGDVSQPQLGSFLNYLQRQAGWKSWVRGLSLRLEVLKGGVSSFAYEAVAAETKCYALAGQVLTKSVLVIARKGEPCDTVCFESEGTRPKINDLDTLPLLLAKNLNYTRKLEMYTGRKCSEGPIQTLTAKAALTGAGRQHLVEKMDELQKCGGHWGRPQNLVKEFAEIAKYDRMEYSTNVKKTDTIQCKSPILQLLIQHGWTWIRKAIFNLKQNFDSCTGDFGPTDLQFSGIGKSSEDKTWSWEEQFGQKKLTQSTSARPFLDNAVKISHQSDHHGLGDYCVIDGQKITTFDGLRVNFTASACSVLVSTPCEGHADVFAVAVKTSSSGGLAVHVVGQIKQFIINVNAAGIDVNGVPMKADEYVKPIHYSSSRGQQVGGYIYKRNGFYKVEIDDTVDVLLKEGKVYIEVADRYRGYMCGMCGNFDDEPSNDLKAPNGCLITDPEQFAKAWTPTVGFECTTEQNANPDTCLKEEPLPRDYYQQYQL